MADGAHVAGLGRHFQAPLRMALMAAALLMPAAALFAYLIGSQVDQLLSDRTLETLRFELQTLRAELDRGGVAALTTAVVKRSDSAGAGLYRLTIGEGHSPVGNLEDMPDGVQSAGGVFKVRNAKDQSWHAAVGLVVPVPGGGSLLVARDMEDQRAFAETLRRAGVEHDRSADASVEIYGDDVDDIGQGPGPGGEADVIGTRGKVNRQLPSPGRNAPVEHRAIVAGHGEHPPKSSGDGSTGVVVGDDDRVISDPQRGHGYGKAFGRGQRMTTRAEPRLGRAIAIEIDEHSSRQMAGVICRLAWSSIEVPAHVGNQQAGVKRVFVQPG